MEFSLGAAGVSAHNSAGAAIATVTPGVVSYSDGTMTVSGVGWQAASTVDVSFTGDGLDNDSKCFGAFTTRVGGDGAFSVSVPVRGSVDSEDGGCQLTVVTEGDGPSASVIFQITD